MRLALLSGAAAGLRAACSPMCALERASAGELAGRAPGADAPAMNEAVR